LQEIWHKIDCQDCKSGKKLNYKQHNEHLLLTVEQTRSADNQTIDSGISGFELLSVAGREVFSVVSELCSASDRILVHRCQVVGR